MADLMGGHVLFGFAQLQTTLPNLREGKLNAIRARTGGARGAGSPTHVARKRMVTGPPVEYDFDLAGNTYQRASKGLHCKCLLNFDL